MQKLFSKDQNKKNEINADIPEIPQILLINNSCMSDMIKAEYKYIQEREEKEFKSKKEEKIILETLQQLLTLQKSNFKTIHAFKVKQISEMKIILEQIKCPKEYSSQYEMAEVDEKKWIEIALKSAKQSESVSWFTERYVRITCSSKAHDIKTRQDNYEQLAMRFQKDRGKGRATDDMLYGLRMESAAKVAFENKTGLKVLNVGLIISLSQPFLACSPDGIIMNQNEVELIEIKCPSSCKDDIIVDFINYSSKVPYLIFNEKILELKENHKYFTQIQVSMYILNIKTCHFVVYSSKDCVHLIIGKNENFLLDIIPKLEIFYFDYYIKVLPKKDSF